MKHRSAEDFASAAMVRVLLQGMSLLGLRPPEQKGDLTQARIPLDFKREVLQSAIAQGGLACLPLLGRGLHALAMEPTHLALTAGRSAGSLFVRWQRLERYIHSQHRIRILHLDTTSAVVAHVHKDQGPKPLAVEDLVVCGVLCALLESNGLKSVMAHANGLELFPGPQPASVSRCVHDEQTGTWHISWAASDHETLALDHSVSWAHVSPKTWSPFACAVGDLVAKRLPEILQADDAANAMGMSRRSLQRALASEGLRYQQLQAEVRFRLAGWNLLQSDIPIAEIGFVCGYADQAHLTREFNKRVGVTPAKYRELFAKQ